MLFPPRPRSIPPGLLVGTSNGRHYTELTHNVYSFSPFVLGPDDIARIHGHNERIGINTFPNYILYYYQLLRNFKQPE